MNRAQPKDADLHGELEYLRHRLAELETEARARDEFLAHLGHELRTPLSPIANLIAVLSLRKDLPEDVRPILEMMERNLWREVQLVEELIDTMRIARGALRLEREPVELDGLVRETVGTLMEDFGKAEVQLVLSLGAAGTRVDADPNRLRQLFRILLEHVCEATPAGGHVTLRTADGGDRGVTISLEDSGAGLSPEELARLFSPLCRSRDQRHGGLRLGLPIAKGIVEAHGGALDAVSLGPGRGTQYSIVLPMAGG